MTIHQALIDATHLGTRRFYGTLAFVLLVSLCTASASAAQERPDGPPPGPPTPEQMEAHLRNDMGIILEKLALSGKTAEQARPILEADIQKRLALVRTHTPGPNRQARDKMHQAMKNLDEETHAALAHILSDTEMERYKQIHKELRANRPRPPKRDNRQR